MTTRTNAADRASQHINDVSPDVAKRLVEIAREMRQLLYGEKAAPPWGTQFTQIESEGMDIGRELARLFMEQSVGEQAGQVPAEALACDGEAAKPDKHPQAATLETAAGKVQWEQPRTHLATTGRAFFPSGPGVGGQH